MPTPPFLSPSVSVDLTLPGNRLRAAVRVTARADSQVSLLPDGVYVPERAYVALRRETNQACDFTSGAVAVEWDAGEASADAGWSSLDPSWVTLREGVWWGVIHTVGVVPKASDPADLYTFPLLSDLAQGFVLESESRYVAINNVQGRSSVVTSNYQFQAHGAQAAGPWSAWISADLVGDFEGNTALVGTFSGHFLVPREERYRVVVRAQSTPIGVPGWIAGEQTATPAGSDPPAVFPSYMVASWMAPYR